MSPRVFAVFLFHLVPFGGDDGIRTHDPLLAGQVLSQLSYTPVFYYGFLSLAGCWPLPIFPIRRRISIVGTTQLNFRVRYGYGWTLCVNGTNYLSVSYSVSCRPLKIEQQAVFVRYFDLSTLPRSP